MEYSDTHLEQIRADVARQRQNDHAKLDDEAKRRLDTLIRDCDELWHDTHTPNRKRKRLLALLIADVTLTDVPPLALVSEQNSIAASRSRHQKCCLEIRWVRLLCDDDMFVHVKWYKCWP